MEKRYPETEVLSRETGYVRDYSRDPYEDCYRRKKGFFSFFRPGPGEEEKELVAGVTMGDAVKAYPVAEIRRRGTVSDEVGGKKLRLVYDPATDALTVRDEQGSDVPYIVVYWFVWKGFHPQSGLYRLEP